MSEQGMTLIQFKTDFAEFEQNRMYPPRYRKEASMLKLTMQHVNAVCHAELIMQTQDSTRLNARTQHKTDEHLLRLAELKLVIIRTMAGGPELPFEEPEN